MVNNLVLISTVIIPTIILLSFLYAKILTQENKHEVVFYILVSTLIFTLFIWLYKIMGGPFKTRGNLAYFIDRLDLNKDNNTIDYNIYGERNDGKSCSIEGKWGGSSPSKPKYSPNKDDDESWSDKCKLKDGEDIDAENFVSAEELEDFEEIYYMKFLLYIVLFAYIVYSNYDSSGKMFYSLIISNFVLFSLWLLLLYIPYDSKDIPIWPEKIGWWVSLIITIPTLCYSLYLSPDSKSKIISFIIFVVVTGILFAVGDINTHFGPKSINKIGSLSYYVKRLGLNKETDKLKYDILIRDRDLDRDCKIVGTWSKNTEIPQITGDIDGCSLDTLGIDVGM